MMAVVIRCKPAFIPHGYDTQALMPVTISYFEADNAVVPLGSCKALVPRNTNLEALEHMLALWSMGDNNEELEAPNGGA